ncbi:MAG: methyltransferase domain-containing protein [Acidobacteriota bacterium]|nr:methyltransferase domain-containing protein [Acidobacteriota bacterium]
MRLSVQRVINSINYRLIRPLVGTGTKDWSSKTDFHKTYRRLVKSLSSSHTHDEAMRMAVGGEFEAIGILERETLIFHGLRRDDYLIDVGCGSGRLAKPLAEYLTGKYLGIDVVPELVAYARRLVARPDWRFEVAEGLKIPEQDGRADVVCFFSVLTHLLHEESYTYLSEAKRVLKPGGKIIFSFLDFSVPGHWVQFEFNLRDIGVGSHPLNVFMCPDMIRVWASHLDLEVEFMQDGEKPYVPLPNPVTLEDGTVVEGKGTVGQSVCVLVRR